MAEKEAKARIKINNLLTSSGWRFLDDKNGCSNIQVEPNVKITTNQIDEFGENFEKTTNGFIDFLLLDENGKPFIVLEAKAEDKDPLIGKEQARSYATSLNARYIILSNGNQHYFWDIENGNPKIITLFPSYESLTDTSKTEKTPSKLYNEPIEEDYIAVIKNKHYKDAPEYKNEETRKAYLEDSGLRMLRKYQLDALRALQDSVKEGKERFLFEMATGTGKTLTSAAVIRLFLRTGNANRVLFLVDRLELETQAKKAFVGYLKPDYNTVIYKENRDDWRKADIVVSTVQSLTFNNKYKQIFKPSDFNVIIADESHRSINGNNRAVFEYFLGYKLGLTATPKDYIKNIDETRIRFSDPKAWEKRQLLDSYRTFGCESGEPTFRYSLLDGVKDGFLINPIVVDARTDITTQLLAEKGYAVTVQGDEKDEEKEETFFARNFERTFFSEETNKILVKTFIDNAKRDPITGEIGKGIVFCVSRHHASKITQLLNEYASKMFDGKYKSDFAMQVTSDIMDAQESTIKFANNNLGGHTSFLEGYKSSKTRMCVTVGMMTTGYDCQDIINIALMRPVFSPTDFIQIKGRGTRKFTFVYKSKEGMREQVTVHEKENFKLFDFFGNCEYFEEKFDYDEVLKLPKPRSKVENGGGEGEPLDGFENFDFDPLQSIVETAIGVEGMKIDRMFFETFENTVKDDEDIRNQYEQGNYAGAIQFIEERILNKPKEYFTWEKLSSALNYDRRITPIEMLDKIYGKIDRVKTKTELINDEFENFYLTQSLKHDDFWEVKDFFGTYLSDKDVRKAIKEENYQSLGTDISSYTFNDLKKVGKERVKNIIDYIDDNVNLSRFS